MIDSIKRLDLKLKYIDSLIRYETVLTTNIYIQIFASTTPVSLYLQSNGMNVVQVFNIDYKDSKYSKILVTHIWHYIWSNQVTNKFIIGANPELEDLELEVYIYG